MHMTTGVSARSWKSPKDVGKSTTRTRRMETDLAYWRCTLCDVLASIQSCYTNTSLTSNIVGYKQKHVSYYNYWTSMLSWDVRELHSMSIYWNNIFSKRISIAIAKLVDGFIYFWFSGYLSRKWHKKNWTNIVTFTWPYFLFIFILFEYVIFVVKQ